MKINNPIDIGYISEKILNKFDNFTDGVRVQMLIDRSIGNNNKGSRRWVNKLISKDKESFKRNIYKLLEQQYFLFSSGMLGLRLYSSVNSRKLDSAIRHFHKSLIDIEANRMKDVYCNIQNQFVSSLMRPEFRESRLCLIDIDIDWDLMIHEKIIKILINDFSENVKNIFTYKTSKGSHLIVSSLMAHNLSFLEDFHNKVYEIKKDALLLLNDPFPLIWEWEDKNE